MYKLGLIGYPVGHSLSPKLHTAALAALGIEGEYLLYPIHPDDKNALSNLLNRVRSGELTGLNVTIPHKQNVIPLMDVLTPSAQAIGAVNAIFMKDGQLVGENTDAPGFLSDLNRTLFSPPPHFGRGGRGVRALVLGAGGSARSVTYALASAGWRVTVTSRRVEQARELVQSLNISRSQYIELLGNENLSKSDKSSESEISEITTGNISEIKNILSEISLIVNATPVGMYPKIDASPWPEGLDFPDGAGVYDLVYNPRETLLVKQVRAAGLRAVTGLGMLIEQALLGFELWTGHKASREVMFSAVEA